MKYLIILNVLIVEISFAQHVLYPLQAGDRWQYTRTGPLSTDSTGYEVKIIGDTTLPNGKKYAMRTSFFPGAFQQDYLRQDSEKVYRVRDDDTTECILYQFDLKIGDSTCQHRFIGQHLRNIFGTSLRVYSFDLYYTDGFGEDVADSVGVINKYYDDGAFDQLTGAVINGVAYGIIGGVLNNKTDEPNDFSLAQNYPNPFNPSTTISFSVAKAGWVNLSVFDPLGQLVTPLVDEVKYPGRYSISWKPQTIPSGAYFYQLRSRDHTDTKLMIYLK